MGAVCSGGSRHGSKAKVIREEEEVPHADGRGDGVADGDADEVDVLRQRAKPVLGNP